MQIKNRPGAFFQSKSGIRWSAAGLVSLAVLGILAGVWLIPLGDSWLEFLLAWAILCILLLIAGWYFLVKDQFGSLNNRIIEIERNASDANRRLESVLQLSRKFVEANDEEEIIKYLLHSLVHLSGAMGASIVPLDEHGQPLTLSRLGEFPEAVTDNWLEYLASPEVREVCGVCDHTGMHVQDLQKCPLVGEARWPYPHSGIALESVYCLPVRRGEVEYGVLNLFLQKGKQLEPEFQEFLRVILAETGRAMEISRLKKRERYTLQQLQAVRQRSELENLLNAFLNNVHETFISDFVVLSISGHHPGLHAIRLDLGEIPSSARPAIEDLLQKVLASGQPALLERSRTSNIECISSPSIIAAPVGFEDSAVVGVLLTGIHRQQRFTSRHQALLRTFAEQVNFVVRNADLMAEIEFNAMIAERTRLAREIHDGLAQTLGFLKLQTAQMLNILASGKLERLEEGLSTTYKVLAEAYLDARQAIDGLRLSPAEEGLLGWLEQNAIEFQNNTGIPVSIENDCESIELQPEVQAQLIRIVQEALSNTRKHAGASHAWISCHSEPRVLIIEVRDDGCGFSPEDVPTAARYGLRGIRERSDLIGAEFEIISRQQEGTIVRIVYPLPVTEYEHG